MTHYSLILLAIGKSLGIIPIQKYMVVSGCNNLVYNLVTCLLQAYDIVITTLSYGCFKFSLRRN